MSIVVTQGSGVLTGYARSGDFAAPYQDRLEIPPSGTLHPPSDAILNDLCQIAAHISQAPWAFISRWENGQETILGSHNWEISTIPPDASLFARLLPRFTAGEDPVLISDARAEASCQDSPLVTDLPRVRFYLAFPLRDDLGNITGTLCTLAPHPKRPDEERLLALCATTAQVAAVLRLREQLATAERQSRTYAQTGESAYWQARHDALTGLPNRTLFLERLQEEMKEHSTATNGKKRTGGASQPMLAVLFMDLNRFKQINDTLGHAVGDMLLREVATRFSESLRPGDTLARIGGDEFTVLLSDVPHPSYAANVAQMMLQALRRPIILAGQELQVGTSVGVALYPQDGTDSQTLLKHADVAMYQAKARGGFQMYSREMNADSYQRFIQEGELRRAIEREELSLAFQPHIELASGEVRSVEALTRWRHPEWGNVPPAHFIELAEQADLLVPLGDWALRQACAACAKWRASGLVNVRVAVNLAARQVAHPGLFDMVSQALAAVDLPGDALELELTETALSASGDGTPEKLSSLRALGVRIFVDDFGTGYSSLAYLRHFPVDGIKIDHAFIAGISRGTPDEALIRAMIEMARALKISVTAEGVENAGQHQFLDSLECDRVQGYFYSRPMSYEALLGVLANL